MEFTLKIGDDPPPPQPLCINCHFFYRFKFFEDRQDVEFIHLSKAQRQDVKRWVQNVEEFDDLGDPGESPPKIYLPVENVRAMGCVLGIWKVDKVDLQDRFGESYTLDIVRNAYSNYLFHWRKDKCYFFPYTVGMDIEAARGLWQRQHETQKELAARQIEDRREATQQAFELSQSRLQQDVIDQEAKRFAESHRISEASHKLNEANKRLTILLTVATVATAIAAIAQVVLAYLTYVVSRPPPTP